MRGHSFPIPLALWAAVLSATGARAQEPPAPIPTPMEERVLVQLVQMPITALDRQGRPVSDLRPEEMVVKLRGREMKVSYLDPLLAPSRDLGPRPEIRLYLDAPGGWSSPAQTATVETRYIAFVLDNENDEPLRRQEALQKTLEFVETQLDPSYRAAVLSYSGTIQLELPFTDDRTALRTALLRASTREGRPRQDQQVRMRRLLDRMDDCVVSRSDFGNTGDPQCIRDVANEYMGEAQPRVTEFIEALEGVVQYMGGLRGRKTVFVMSHGRPVDPAPVLLSVARSIFGNSDALSELQLYIGFGDRARNLMDDLLVKSIRNRVTLTFLDRTSPPTGDFQASRGTMLSPGTFPMRAEYDAAVADMEEIAFTSGGIHVTATDMGDALREAFDAQKGAYELGFQTDEYLDPDRMAKIVVSSTRKGVKITHRKGVYAAPSQAEHSLRGRIAFLKGRPLEGENARGVHQPFRLEVDPDAIGYQVGEVEATADFTVHFEVLSREGTSLADTYHFVSHSFDLEVWRQTQKPPMTLAGWVELPPGDYILRAWIRNVRNEREGSIQQAVRVPEKNRAVTPATSGESKPAGSE